MTEFTIPGINAGHNILTGPDGNLWVAGGVEGSLIKATTEPSYTIFDTSGFTQNLIQGKNQDFWFAQYQGSTQIAHITTSGVITEYPTPNIDIIIALAVDDDGNLWFMDIYADKISKMNYQGEITSYLLPKKLNQAIDMIFGPDKNLWFVETTTGKVNKIDTSTLQPTPTEEPNPTPTEPPAEENNGYNNGYNNEFNNNFNNEYNNGYNNGYMSEFNSGYNSGFNNNYNNGYNNGFNNGYNNGYQE
jgi:hypothetical protein